MPSKEKSSASKVILFPFTSEWTPTAVSQSPSKTFKTFGSEFALKEISLWFTFSNID